MGDSLLNQVGLSFYCLVVLAVSSLILGCGSANPTTSGQSSMRIIGGEPLGDQSPLSNSTVLLVTYDANGQSVNTCTGNVISRDLIITAAHCVAPTEAADAFKTIKAYFGAVPAQSGQHLDKNLLIDTIDYRAAPGWQATSERVCQENIRDDIAIIKIAASLPFGFSPSLIAHNSDFEKVGLPVLVAGFGSPGTSTFAKSVLSSMVFSVPSSTTDQLSIISTPSQGTTPGDSGGPVATMINGYYRIFAVISNHCDLQTEFVEPIFPHLSWLHQAASEMQGDDNF